MSSRPPILCSMGTSRTCLLAIALVFLTAACDGADIYEGEVPDTSTTPDVTADTSVPDAIPDPVADPAVDPAVDTGPDAITDTVVDPSVPPYGFLDANLDTSFILDGTRLEEDGYIEGHLEGIAMGGAFRGTYGTAGQVPPAGAPQTFALTMHVPPEGMEPPRIVVFQQSRSMAGTMDPAVQLIFPTDALSPGTMIVGLSEDGSVPMIFLMQEIESEDPCVLAVVMGGSLEITRALETTLPEGGELAFSGSMMPLYHPTMTPAGDLTDVFAASGTPICPME